MTKGRSACAESPKRYDGIVRLIYHQSENFAHHAVKIELTVAERDDFAKGRILGDDRPRSKWCIKSHPAASNAGLMNFVQISRSVSDVLSMSLMRIGPMVHGKSILDDLPS